MANYRGQGVQISPFDPQPPESRGLPSSTAGAANAADEALSGVSSFLSAKVGALGDQLAQNEGRRAGLVAGTDPNFRPSDGWTIRAQAQDKAATDVYMSNLTAQFHSDALDAYEANKANPAGFKQAYDGLVQTYQQSHVFPEIAGAFTENATKLSTVLRRSVLDGFDTKLKDQQHASLIGNMATRETAAQRILAIDPHDPIAEQTVMRLRDEDIADLKAQVAAGSITALQGEKLILEKQQDAQVKLASARAATLPNADAIDAYRAQIKADFTAGKTPGLQDWGGLDAELGKLSRQKRLDGDRQMATLQSDLGDFLSRDQNGLAGTADWSSISAKGKAIGPAGVAAVAAAQQKLAIRRRIASLAPDEADGFVQGLEKTVKATPGGSISAPGAFATGYSPQRMGDRIEGGYESSVPGPDGRKIVRTLEDVRNGSAPYVTLAGDPSLYGREYVLPSVTYTANGETHTLNNVRGVVHDTGSAFRGAPEGRFDIAIGRDLNDAERNQSMRSASFVPANAGVTASAADILSDARAYRDARRQMVSTDPLLAATRDGSISEITPVDFAAAPDALAPAFRQRIAQADAVAASYRRAPSYIRPDEKPVLLAQLDKGGDAALSTVMGLVAGAGTRAPQVLKEIGDGAPALAHAAQVTLSTGDPAFARQVAEAQAARAVPGSKPSTPKEVDVDTAMRKVVGPALQGLDSADDQRTRAAVVAWSEREMMRRGVPFDDLKGMQTILEEGVQRARGRVGAGDQATGGIVPVAYGPPGWISAHGNTVPVQVPASVKAAKFADVIGAITDDDLSKLADPPVDPKGRVISAGDLRRNAPVFGPGGYRFVTIDATTGAQTPIVARSGQPFMLPWADLAPVLRGRVPQAFR